MRTRLCGQGLLGGLLGRVVSSRFKSRIASENTAMLLLQENAGAYTSVFTKSEWCSSRKHWGKDRGARLHRDSRPEPLDGFSRVEVELKNNNWQKGTEIGR